MAALKLGLLPSHYSYYYLFIVKFVDWLKVLLINFQNFVVNKTKISIKLKYTFLLHS